MKDDESRIGSNNLRSSNILDLEDSGGASQHRNSMQRIDMLNRSFSGKDTKAGTRNPDLVKSIRSEQNDLKTEENFKEALEKQEAHNWSSKGGNSARDSDDDNK
jgi:hypothetical protein